MTLVSISHEYSEKNKIDIIIKDNKLLISDTINSEELTEISLSFIKFLREIELNNLLRSDEIKPIIDGNEVMNMFNVRGNKISAILNKCIEFQVLYPNFLKQEIIDLVSKNINEK